MPVTPFHFGPGAAIHALAPKHISFIAFCVCNVLIDVETLYYILTSQYPLHRFFHTYIGATIAAVMTILLFLAARRLAKPLRLPNLFGWRDLMVWPVSLGAALGAWSHVVLDSIMHDDIRPFRPFSDENPLHRVLSLPALHLLCLVLGIVAVGIVGARWLGKRQ